MNNSSNRQSHSLGNHETESASAQPPIADPGFQSGMDEAKQRMRRAGRKLLWRVAAIPLALITVTIPMVLFRNVTGLQVAFAIIAVMVQFVVLVMLLQALGELGAAVAHFLRDRRLRNRRLPGGSAKAAPFPYRNRFLGLVLHVLGVIVFIAVLGGMLSLGASSPIHLSVSIAAALTVSFSFFYIGRQLRSRSACEVLARDRRAPVLYLRSFAADDAAGFMGQQLWQFVAGLAGKLAKSSEQQLVTELNKIGPVVAIGRPGEALPKLGAARLYVGDDWQKTVKDLAERAVLTVLRVGGSEGLKWEMLEIVRKLNPERVLLCQADGWPSEQARVYELFRQRVDLHLPHPLPSFEEVVFDEMAPFVAFDAEWRPIPLRGISPVLERHKLGDDRQGRRFVTSAGLRERDERRLAKERGGGLTGRILQSCVLIVIATLLCLSGIQWTVDSLMPGAEYYRNHAWPKLLGQAVALIAAGTVIFAVPAARWWLIYVPAAILLAVLAFIFEK